MFLVESKHPSCNMKIVKYHPSCVTKSVRSMGLVDMYSLTLKRNGGDQFKTHLQFTHTWIDTYKYVWL